MIRNRISRITVSVGLALSLSLSLIALPAIVLAALPDVQVGRGAVAQVNAASGAIPTEVGPGEPVLIQVWAYNNDTSNVSQFYLDVTTNGTLTSAAWTKSSGESGTCAPTTDYTCSFGQLKSGVSLVVSALFTAGSAGTMTNGFEFSTTGLGSGTGDQSHGDTWTVQNDVTVDGTGDFGGRYVTTTSLTTVSNNQSLGPTNKQSTIVYSPATGIGVTVEDGPGAGSGGCAVGATCFSQTSQINVGNGATFSSGFKVVVNLHNSQIPSGVNASNLVVYHDGVQITDKCGKTPDPDCYSVKKFSWGLQVTIWLTQNGNIKFA